MNLTKPDSLFNQGLQPVLFHTEEAERTGQGWVRTGESIAYFANNYQRHVSGPGGPSSGEGLSTYFTLTFTIAFPRGGETYLLAHSYPYTYSDLKAHLKELLSSSSVARHVRHDVLCRTLGGHDCHVLTITEDGNDELTTPEPEGFGGKGGSNGGTGGGGGAGGGGSTNGCKKKKGIIITGRVHPGETQASWMMRGILEFLTGSSPQAKLLRSIFVFKVRHRTAIFITLPQT